MGFMGEGPRIHRPIGDALPLISTNPIRRIPALRSIAWASSGDSSVGGTSVPMLLESPGIEVETSPTVATDPHPAGNAAHHDDGSPLTAEPITPQPAHP